jgi:hypothetical protein
VLTSDDVEFSADISEPVVDEVGGVVASLYEKIVSGRREPPALLMPFIPFMSTVGSDEFVAELNKASGGLTTFGTVCISNEIGFGKSFIICNDGYYPSSMALLALFGEVKPSFLEISVNDDKILRQKAVVTEIHRNVLQSVNNISAIQYLKSIGMAAENFSTDSFITMPFVFYLEDGSNLIRACVGITPEGGAILCGTAPVNSVFALSIMGPEDVIQSTASKVIEALGVAAGRGLLMYSCAARNWVLGVKDMAEHEKVRECIGDKAPYQLSYSGGEIYPAPLASGGTINHLQNDSLIICIL